MNRVAVVTGSSRGIGKAIAIALAKEGANVVIAARTEVENESLSGTIYKTAEEIRALGRRALPIKCDVTNEQSVKDMVQKALGEFGHIDILVNNAGGSARERKSFFYESTEEVWDYVISLNLKGVRHCTRTVINHMIERQSGKIVNIASTAGVVGAAGMVDYSAAKAGVIGFSMALAKEVASYGINVNCVSPGPIETEVVSTQLKHTEQFEQIKQGTGFGRLGKPEEVAAMVVFLVSDEASFITGQNFAVCGLRNLGL